MVQSLDLCEDCIEKYLKGEQLPVDLPSIDDLKEVSCSMMGVSPKSIEIAKISSDISGDVCPGCKSTILEILKMQQLGCPQCYEYFGKKLEPMLASIHQTEPKHVGKVPKKWLAKKQAEERAKRNLLPIAKRIQQANLKMNVCAKEEDYERAAQIRDQIKELERVGDRITRMREKLRDIIANEEYEVAEALKQEVHRTLDKFGQIESSIISDADSS